MGTVTKLNSMQQFMIQLFDRNVSSKQEDDIKQLLANYFSKQIDEEMDSIWVEREMTQKGLDNALKMHKCTKY